MVSHAKTYFDLFAGIGLVDYALDKSNWSLDLAVDYDKKKFRIYKEQFAKYADRYNLRDIYSLRPADLPSSFLGHASFPCTDVSEAGRRQGVREGNQSSAIDSVLSLLYSKEYAERPEVLLTENVKGLLTSNGGADIRYLLSHYNSLGYSNDVLLVDAKHFVPQSRQRIFILSFKEGITPKSLIADQVTESWMRPKAVMKVIRANSDLRWTYLIDRPKPENTISLDDIIDRSDEDFWAKDRTDYLLSQMSNLHERLIDKHLHDDVYNFFTVFRRMRVRDGRKQSTAEVRSDGLAGCLRTAKGGSAKQILLRVGKGRCDVRLLNKIECARLMGAPDFRISDEISLNDYLYAFGDGVCSSAIEWLDQNYLTPIYENGNSSSHEASSQTQYTMNLSSAERKRIADAYKAWKLEHNDSVVGLPIKGRLYGALIVLLNLRESEEEGDWSYRNTLHVNSTDKGTHFGDRSIKNHTGHRLNLALSKLNRPDLKPRSGGEAGRTSTGTKRAGLGIIEIINSAVGKVATNEMTEVGDEVVDLINQLVIADLDRHADLGGIEVSYQRNETIGAFITKIINAKVSNPGAVCQHLVGAKLEYKFQNDDNVDIRHHNSSAADTQTNRYGDFDIASTAFHITKSPNEAHFRKALDNAIAGRTVYILVPEIMLATTVLTKNIDPRYTSKVNVYSIEQFISQNIDELAHFNKELSVAGLKDLLKIYNRLIEKYENDNSLKVVPPDFGV